MISQCFGSAFCVGFAPDQLQCVAAARALKIAKLIARHHPFSDAAQHLDLAVQAMWPVVDNATHRASPLIGLYQSVARSSAQFPTHIAP